MGDDTPITRRSVLRAAGATAGIAVGAAPVQATQVQTQSDPTPNWEVENGVAVTQWECSTVRIFGNGFEADTVTIGIGYYSPDGNWFDEELVRDADLPMTVDAEAVVGEEDHATGVSIGGVTVEDADGNNLVHYRNIDCHHTLEEPLADEA